jgi:tetratricopeptide (TPR) repeat protein
MGLFGFFKKKHTEPTSGNLRERLFATIQANNWPRLAELCEEHHDEIVRAWVGWKTPPKAVHGNPEAGEQFGQCMATLADFFARVRGEPELLEQLIGPPDDNPIMRMEKKLQQALALMEEVRYQEVIPMMTGVLDQLQGWRGEVVGGFQAKAYGHLGCSYFQTGCPAEAVGPLEQALHLCRQRGDAEGHVIHLSNLFEVHRYLGQSGPAADYAEQLAEQLAQQGKDLDATWMRRQATIVRAGEPLVRLIAQVKHRRYELDEVILQPGVFTEFLFHRNRLTLAPSQLYQLQAKKTWAQGQAKETLDHLLAAIKADRFDPDPFYQMGVVVLYSSMYDTAVACFQKAEELAPGWFFCRRYLWLAQQLAQAKLDQHTFLTLQELDDNPQVRTPEAKVSLAREALAETPSVAWLHLCLGSNLKELKQCRDAEAAFRRGLDCADDPDLKSCLLLELAALQERSSPQRTQLLEEVRNLNGNLNATASANLILKLDAEAQP